MTLIVFYGLAATAVTAAILVVLMSRAVYSALALIVCFGATAGLFFQLGAQFIAAVQVIVYAGAIMVLFLFVIMLLDPESELFLPSSLEESSWFRTGLCGVAHPGTFTGRGSLGRCSSSYRLDCRHREALRAGWRNRDPCPLPLSGLLTAL